MAPLFYIPTIPIDPFIEFSGQFLLFAVGNRTLTSPSRRKLKNVRLEVCNKLDLENRLDELKMCEEDKNFILLMARKITEENNFKDDNSK